MSDHIVRAFDNDLKSLTTQISEMGGQVERMVSDSILALTRLDTGLAQELIVRDREIDNLQKNIDEAAILTIAKRQPVAQDLRAIISSIRISNDLERVGDMAKNIARRTIEIDGQMVKPHILHGLQHLTELALGQLKDVLDAYAARDVDLANTVWARDDQVDAFYTSVFRELLTYMIEDARNITLCTHLLFCAKNIERVGDHTTNIAETINYVVTGQTVYDPSQNNNAKDSIVGEGLLQ